MAARGGPNRFFERFEGPSWAPKPPKMSSSWAQNASLEASWRPLGGQLPFQAMLGRFLSPCWGHVGAQNHQKTRSKSNTNRTSIVIVILSALEAVLGLFWDPPEPEKTCFRLDENQIFTKINVFIRTALGERFASDFRAILGPCWGPNSL